MKSKGLEQFYGHFLKSRVYLCFCRSACSSQGKDQKFVSRFREIQASKSRPSQSPYLSLCLLYGSAYQGLQAVIAEP